MWEKHNEFKRQCVKKIRLIVAIIVVGLIASVSGCSRDDVDDGMAYIERTPQPIVDIQDDLIEEVALFAGHILVGRWDYVFGQNAGFFSDGEIGRIQFHDDGQFRVLEEVDGYLRNWATRTWEPIDDGQLSITDSSGITTIYTYTVIESGDTPPRIRLIISKDEWTYESYELID